MRLVQRVGADLFSKHHGFNGWRIERFLSQPGGLNYGQAMAMATILMTLTIVSILLIEKFRLPESIDF